MKNELTVKLLRDACKGLPANEPVKLLVKLQTGDEIWPITGVSFSAKSITLIVDGMAMELEDIEFVKALRLLRMLQND